MGKPSKRVQEAAKELLKKNKGKGDTDFGYRAYLRFVVKGETGNHLTRQLKGDQRKGVLKAQDELLEASIAKRASRDLDEMTQQKDRLSAEVDRLMTGSIEEVVAKELSEITKTLS